MAENGMELVKLRGFFFSAVGINIPVYLIDYLYHCVLCVVIKFYEGLNL